MHFSDYINLLLLFVPVLMSPGPANLLVLQTGLFSTRKNSLHVAMGLILGSVSQLILLLACRSSIDTTSTTYFVLSSIGIFVLFSLGYNTIKSYYYEKNLTQVSPKKIQLTRPFFSGLLIELTNPIALVLFFTLIDSVIPKEISLSDCYIVILELSSLVSAWYLSLAILANKVQKLNIGIIMQNHYIFGVFFIILGGVKLLQLTGIL